MRAKLNWCWICSSVLLLTSELVWAESGFYGSLRIGIAAENRGDDTFYRTSNFESRIGFAGEHELTSGLTAFGKYELGVDDNSFNGTDDLITRKAFVGLLGGLGTLMVGLKFHTWHNTVLAPVDRPWWRSCNGCISYSRLGTNGLSYSSPKLGALTAGATVYMEDDSESLDGEEEVDGIELGATLEMGSVRLGFATQDLADEEDPALGIAFVTTLSNVTLAANVTNRGDATGVDFYANLARFYFDAGGITNDQTDVTSTGLTLGYTMELGERTLMWFEGFVGDSGLDDADLDTEIRIALKYDWN